MNTQLIGLVSVILGTIRKARGIEMRPGTLARATLTLLLLSAWGAATAHGDEQRVPHVRPLVFEANRGQADEQVKFLARGTGYTVFLTSTDALLSLRDGRSGRAVVRVKPVGASAAARIVADGELPGVVNYAGRAAGAETITAPTYARVRYVDLYPGVDLVYYDRPRQLEYDFVLAPGADPGQIALTFDGAERLEIDAGGDLVIHTAAGELRQPRPVVYQEIFSADTQKSADDRLLTGTRSVPTLAAGAASTLTVTVTIPSATPPGTYFLLACADDTKLVAESDEANNCLASAGAITVALPDLVEQTVSNSGGPFRRGTVFTVSDTVVNTSRVGTPTSATTRHYLSLDGVRNTGDILLIGARTVPILGPSASSSASIAVTIPSSTLPGTYVLLACADDTKVVVESNDTNNCRASGTAVGVTP